MPLKPVTKKVTVTTAGTAVALSSTIIDAVAVLIEVPTSNTGGIIGPGSSDVASANADVVSPGQSKTLSAPDSKNGTEGIDLTRTYIDAETNGDVAYITYFVRT